MSTSPSGGDDGHANPARLRPFALERYFARYEFSVKHLACCSDSEPLTLNELLAMADEETRQQWDSLSLGYTESLGLPALREEIARRQYTTLTANDILVAAPQEAIFLAMHALISPKDHIICMAPCYQSLYEIANSLNASISFWTPRCDPHKSGSLEYDVADLVHLLSLQPGTKLVLVNVPHNPTGWIPSHAAWEGIIAACKDANAHLYSDEMYRGLELHPSLRLTPAADLYPERGISLSGMSKAVGLPGLRIGWLATKDAALLQRAAHLKDYTTICGAAPSEVLALMALRAWDRIIMRQLGIIIQNLGLLEEFKGRWKGFVEWEAPSAGTVAFPRFKLPVSSTDFCKDLAEKHSILLLPGIVYTTGVVEVDTPAELEQRCRIGFGRRNFPEVLQVLEKALQTMGLKNT